MISPRSPGVNLHFEICPSLGWSLGSLSTNFYTNSARSKKQGKKAAEQAAKLGTWHSGCDPLLCSQSATGLWVFSFASPPSQPLLPKAHRMNSARVSSSHSIFSFILPVEHVAPGLAPQQEVRARRESFLSPLAFQGCLSSLVQAVRPSSSNMWEETKEVLVLFPVRGNISYMELFPIAQGIKGAEMKVKSTH